MPVQQFRLPDPGEGLTEAEIVTWRVAVGDTVKVNDIVVEIETAKSLVELPIPWAGTVAALLAPEGATEPVAGAQLAGVAREGPVPGEDVLEVLGEDGVRPEQSLDAHRGGEVRRRQQQVQVGRREDQHPQHPVRAVDEGQPLLLA